MDMSENNFEAIKDIDYDKKEIKTLSAEIEEVN